MKTYMSALFGVILCGLGFYIYTLPGDMVITMEGWRLHAPLWIGIMALFFGTFILFLVFLGIRFILRLPSRIATHFATRRMKKGVASLNQVLISYYAQDAINILDKCTDLEEWFPSPVVGLWCRSMVLKKGNSQNTAQIASVYKTLKTTAGGTFLGLYGLIELAQKEGDTLALRQLLEEAYEARPSSEWAKYQLVEFYLKEGLWEKAKHYIDILEPRSPLEKQRKKMAKSQLWLLQAQEEGRPLLEQKELLMEAHEVCPVYGPAAIAYASELVRIGKRAKALSVLEDAWKGHPTRELGEAYLAQALGGDPLASFEMARTLLSWAPDQNLARFLVIEAALRAQLWGEAERYLKEVAQNKGEPLYYELQARWWEESKKDPERARLWRKEGLEAMRARE